ncbi:unnamed protein product [Gordionus sp. m RMFG-2023]
MGSDPAVGIVEATQERVDDDSQPDSDVELMRTGNHLEARDGAEDERSNEEGVEESTIQESLNMEEDREEWRKSWEDIMEFLVRGKIIFLGWTCAIFLFVIR